MIDTPLKEGLDYTPSQIEYKNIFYMLMYNNDVYCDLQKKEQDIENISSILDFLAELLIESFKELLQDGMFSSFNSLTTVQQKPYGKLDIPKSYRTGGYAKGNLVCTINTLDIDNYYNQTIKAAFRRLLKLNSIYQLKYTSESNKIKPKYIRSIRYYINLMSQVTDIEYTKVNFDMHHISYGDIPLKYKTTYQISKVILNNFIPNSESDGIRQNLFQLNDTDKMAMIYQHFLINLAERSFYSSGYKVIGDKETSYTSSNPDSTEKLKLRPDGIIYNTVTKKLLIIDAKYYNSRSNDIEGIGIGNGEIGKSMMYGGYYKLGNTCEQSKRQSTHLSFQDYDVATIIVMPKNIGDSSYIETFRTDPNPVFNFSLGVYTHSLSRNFSDIKKDILDIFKLYV